MADPAPSDQKYYDFLGVSPSASIPELKAAWAYKFRGDDYSVLGVEHGASAAEIKKATQRATMITHPDRLPQRLTADPEFVAYSGHQFNEVKQRAEWLVSSKSARSHQNEFTNGGQASNSNTDGFDYEAWSSKYSSGGASARDRFNQARYDQYDDAHTQKWAELPKTEKEAIRIVAACDWTMGAEIDFTSTHVPHLALHASHPLQKVCVYAALNILQLNYGIDRSRAGNGAILVDGYEALLLRGYIWQGGGDPKPKAGYEKLVNPIFAEWEADYLKHYCSPKTCKLSVMKPTPNAEDVLVLQRLDPRAQSILSFWGGKPEIDEKTGLRQLKGADAQKAFDRLADLKIYVELESGLEPRIACAYERIAGKPLPLDAFRSNRAAGQSPKSPHYGP